MLLILVYIIGVAWDSWVLDNVKFYVSQLLLDLCLIGKLNLIVPILYLIYYTFYPKELRVKYQVSFYSSLLHVNILMLMIDFRNWKQREINLHVIGQSGQTFIQYIQ